MQLLCVSIVSADLLFTSVAQDMSRNNLHSFLPTPPFPKNLPSLFPELPLSLPPISRQSHSEQPYTVYINTGNYHRRETSDGHGNVRGEYSYNVRDVENTIPGRRRFPSFRLPPLVLPILNNIPGMPLATISKFPAPATTPASSSNYQKTKQETTTADEDLQTETTIVTTAEAK